MCRSWCEINNELRYGNNLMILSPHNVMIAVNDRSRWSDRIAAGLPYIQRLSANKNIGLGLHAHKIWNWMHYVWVAEVINGQFVAERCGQWLLNFVQCFLVFSLLSTASQNSFYTLSWNTTFARQFDIICYVIKLFSMLCHWTVKNYLNLVILVPWTPKYKIGKSFRSSIRPTTRVLIRS